MKDNSKAISIRMKEEDFAELMEMKTTWCEVLGEEMTTNKWIKEMIRQGFFRFVDAMETSFWGVDDID